MRDNTLNVLGLKQLLSVRAKVEASVGFSGQCSSARYLKYWQSQKALMVNLLFLFHIMHGTCDRKAWLKLTSEKNYLTLYQRGWDGLIIYLKEKELHSFVMQIHSYNQ